MTVLTNHRRERFVHGLIAGETATAAYIAAGYSKRGAAQSAQRLLSNPEIQARKAELEEKVVARFVAGQITDRAFRVGLLQENVEKLRGLRDTEGGPSVAAMREMREQLKQAAIEHGDWQESQPVRGESDAHADLKGMTVEELYIERDALLQAQAEAKRKIEQLRASRQIEAAPGSVQEVSGTETVEEVTGDQPTA